MASKKSTSTVQVECKILDIQKVPNSTAQIVSIEFRIGERVWNRAFKVNYERPVSMEEFKKDLVKYDLIPKETDDFLVYVKEEADKPFTLEIERAE